MTHQETQWETKAQKLFKGAVVHKLLARTAGLPRLPQYVVEYLVANHVTPKHAQRDLHKVRERVAEVLPEAEKRELFKAELLNRGKLLIFDKMDVSVDMKSGEFVGTLTHMGLTKVKVPKKMVKRIPRLLTGGTWGAIELRYHPGEGRASGSVEAYAMTAFQQAATPLKQYIRKRGAFSTAEWLDLLLTSVGYAPKAYPDRRSKLLMLMRLLPAIEPNYNSIELGPRQTGKTYLLRNLSPSVYTASGAQVTAASLFANAATGALGIVGTYKIVVLDEIAHTRFDSPSTVSAMKDYMESGQFARGGRTYSSDSSIVLAGNIDVAGRMPSSMYRHLFEPLPSELEDTAFLDRVHAYIPGWEIPKIDAHSISTGYGLSVDYLSQVMQELRDRDFRYACHSVDLQAALPQATHRDLVAVEKTTSGMLKLLHPDGKYTGQELSDLVRFAVEHRVRVVEQLSTMAPGEFHTHTQASGGAA